MFGSGISKKEHEEVKAKVEKLTKELRQREEMVAKYKAQASEYSASLKEAEKKVKQSQSQMATKVSELKAALSRAQQSSNASGEVERKLQEAEAALHQEKAKSALKLKKLQDRLDAKKGAATDLQARLELDVEERDETIAAQKRELDIFQKRISELETECEEWEGKLANVEESFKGDALDGRMRALEKELYEKTVSSMCA